MNFFNFLFSVPVDAFFMLIALAIALGYTYYNKELVAIKLLIIAIIVALIIFIPIQFATNKKIYFSYLLSLSMSSVMTVLFTYISLVNKEIKRIIKELSKMNKSNDNKKIRRRRRHRK